MWCTSVGQEIPVLVYTLLMCKLVDTDIHIHLLHCFNRPKVMQI